MAASEYPVSKCTLIDLESSCGAAVIEGLVTELNTGNNEDAIALRSNGRYVQRFNRGLPKELQEGTWARRSSAAADDCAFALEVGKPGSIESLRFRQIQRRTPSSGEVEVKVQVAGLNFKDILKVLGILREDAYENTFHGHGLGMEAAGIVTQVGGDVNSYQVGDAIIASLPNSFSSHVCVPADSLFALRQTPRLTRAEAAAIPVAFMTAYYALIDVARLSSAERVLIHAATGGVGLAAIQVAQWIGAEIFATAGSPQKRDYLRSLGVKHIFDSRSLDFADEILLMTHGQGVDVILNSISGEALLKSFSLLAPFGRFVEIGKRDILENSSLPMLPFNRNLSLSAIDLDRMMAERPALIHKTLEHVWDHLCSGVFGPLPVKLFPAGKISEAFRYMAESKHVGKIVIDMEDTAGMCPLPTVESEKPIKADGTYLITGGFGGIGLELGKWLVEQGARNLVLIGRRGPHSAQARKTVAELQAKGVSVLAAAVDISEEQQVAAVIDEVAKTMPPLRGVFHAAAILEDASLINLDERHFSRVMDPKARGAWLLHEHIASLPIDFFVLFSSISAWIGNAGQASYAAANTFLDSLAQHRRALGLPATSIALGSVGDVGMVAERDLIARHLALLGIQPIPIASLMELLPSVLRWNPIQIGIMDVDWARWTQTCAFAKDSRRFCHLVAEPESGLEERNLVETLATLAPQERLEKLAAGIAEIVSEALHIPSEKIDRYQPFTQMGIDSLLGVEMQTTISLKLGISVSTLELMNSGGIIGLAEELLKKIGIRPASMSASK